MNLFVFLNTEIIQNINPKLFKNSKIISIKFGKVAYKHKDLSSSPRTQVKKKAKYDGMLIL